MFKSSKYFFGLSSSLTEKTVCLHYNDQSHKCTQSRRSRKVSAFCRIWTKTRMWQISVKKYIKFHETPPTGNRTVTCRQTDGRTDGRTDMAKLTPWNLPITEQQGTEVFFRCRRVPFNTGTSHLDPRDCKCFLLKTSLRYAKVPFKTGFTVVIFRNRVAEAQTL